MLVQHQPSPTPPNSAAGAASILSFFFFFFHSFLSELISLVFLLEKAGNRLRTHLNPAKRVYFDREDKWTQYKDFRLYLLTQRNEPGAVLRV